MISGLSLDDEAAKIQQLRQLLEAATPGPWALDDDGDSVDVRAHRGAGPTVAKTVPLGYEIRRSNAALIAAARNALPWLLDRLVEARADWRAAIANGTELANKFIAAERERDEARTEAAEAFSKGVEQVRRRCEKAEAELATAREALQRVEAAIAPHLTQASEDTE